MTTLTTEQLALLAKLCSYRQITDISAAQDGRFVTCWPSKSVNGKDYDTYSKWDLAGLCLERCAELGKPLTVGPDPYGGFFALNGSAYANEPCYPDAIFAAASKVAESLP